MTATTTTRPPTPPGGDDGAPETPAPGFGFAPAVTGFRAIGAVVVVLVHVWFSTRIFPWTGAIRFFSIVMPVFFVVSAYSLFRPFITSQIRDEPRSAVAFWWKRFLRIYPLYAVALTVYLVVLPGIRPPSGRVIDYIKLYTFLQIYDPKLATFSGIPAAWFLCDEVAFYAALPALALLGRWFARSIPSRRPLRRVDALLRGHTILAVLLIVIGQASRAWFIFRRYPTATSLPITNCDFYGFGILLATFSVREEYGRAIPRVVDWVRRRSWVTIATLVVGALLMNVIGRLPDVSSGPAEDYKRYLIYALMLLPLMPLLTLGDPTRGVDRFLSSPRWYRLAILSLHVYLWHQLLTGGWDRYVSAADTIDLGNRFLTGAVTMVGSVVIVVVWSALWQPLLDLPYRRWSKVIPRPADAAPAPSWLKPAAFAGVAVLLVSGVWVSIRYGGSPLHARGGTELVTVTGARPGDRIEVRSDGALVAAATADERGTSILRSIDPGTYDVLQRRDDRTVLTRTATVLGVDDHPDRSLYTGQHLRPGLQEIVTRDGTRLSAYVDLPGPVDEGPYPTVVELSAYRIGDAHIVQQATAVARAFGFATVSVNTRGTGCSSGAFDFLSPADAADGYDVVETVAAQSWAAGHQAGLVGFSFSGLAALQAAGTTPPSLNGVSAMSVYGDAWNALHPGGLANVGFPVGWLDDLSKDAEPAGAPWIAERIEDGDTACAANQLLHGQMPDLESLLGDRTATEAGGTREGTGTGTAASRAEYRARFDDLSPNHWAPGIRVPVFLSTQFQDATVGNDAISTIGRYSASPFAKLVVTNGTHGDAMAPQILERLYQFMNLYNWGRTPPPMDRAEILRKADPKANKAILDLESTPPLTIDPTLDVAAARQVYERAGRVELLVNSGGGSVPGGAAATGTVTFPSWPPLQAQVEPLRLGPGGTLTTDTAPADAPAVSLRTAPSVAGAAYNIEGSNILRNTMTPWRQPTAGSALGWITAPVAEDRLIAGNVSLTVWIKPSARDVDLQTVLSDVDPDGNETLIQVGWRRLSDMGSTAGTRDGWQRLTFDIGGSGHVLYRGSRLRLQLGTPGDGQVQWSFAPSPAGPQTVQIAQAGDLAGVLSVPEMTAPADLGGPVACGDLRAQPCRRYVPSTNEEPTP